MFRKAMPDPFAMEVFGKEDECEALTLVLLNGRVVVLSWS